MIINGRKLREYNKYLKAKTTPRRARLIFTARQRMLDAFIYKYEAEHPELKIENLKK